MVEWTHLGLLQTTIRNKSESENELKEVWSRWRNDIQFLVWSWIIDFFIWTYVFSNVE